MEILIISGLSGAGKSRAASFLEDMGFYIVDNMPAAMILKFAEFCAGGSQRYDKVALVYDVRTANSPTELFDVLDQLKTGFRDGVSYEDLYQRLLYGADCPADQYLLLADFASYCAASHRVVDTYADREKWNRMSLHNIARSGIFSADRSIADYADTIWHVPYKK